MNRTQLVSLVLATACIDPLASDDVLSGLEDFAEFDLPVDAAGPPATTYLELGVTALDAEETVVLDVRGATPGSRVYFVRGSQFGPGACLPALRGACLQVQGPIAVMGSAVADAAGEATLSSPIPAMLPGRSMAFQAVTLRPTVQLSEPQERTTRPFGSTDPYGVGATWQPTNPTFLRAGLMISATIGIAEPVEVTGFVCQGRTLGGSYRAGLYDDLAMHPHNLLARSGAVHVNVGPNYGANLLPPVVLQPGRYWLSVVSDSTIDTWSNDLSADNPEFVGMQTFHLALPDPMLSGAPTVGPRLACSVEVR